MVNKKKFFDSIRLRIFNGELSQEQVEGCDLIIDTFFQSGFTDTRWLAYMLATTYHETAHTMQPIKEFGNDSYFIRRYWLNKRIAKQLGNVSEKDAIRFCGKGYVQITGRRNYTLFSKLLAVDLIENSNLALKPEIAVDILVKGMVEGLFTGKKLSDYFNSKIDDWLNARKIVNGTDQMAYIADKGQKFFDALLT